MRPCLNVQGRLLVVLAAALLFLCLCPVALAEEVEQTEPGGETVAYTETTLPATTFPVTEPTAAETTEAESTEAAPGETTEAAAEEAAPETTRETTAEQTQTIPQSIPETEPALTVSLPEASEDGTWDSLWYPVTLEDILPTDILAITMTQGGGIWALSSENAERSAPEAVPVLLDNGVMRSGGSGLCWKLEKTGEGIRLRPADGQLWLHTGKGKDSLRVGDQGSPDWTVSGETLYHPYTGRYLRVDVEQGIWHTAGDAPQGQALVFWRKERTAPVTAMPAGGVLAEGERVTLSCAGPNAQIYYSISADGETYDAPRLYTQPISMEGEALYIKAFTQSPENPDGPEMVFFYVRTPETEKRPEWELPYGLYFGQLHAHTGVSDGWGSVEEAFRYAAGVEGLDFFAVTDHSDSLENFAAGSIGQDGTAVSGDWQAGKAAARDVTSGEFVGLYGYEMAWPRGKNLGHIGTFATPGWQSWKQEEDATLESYYKALATVPGAIGQFNHPGEFYGKFEEFSHYNAAYDQRMTLLEVGGESGFRAYGAYTQALDMGWHVAPTSGESPRSPGWTGTARTVLLAGELTEDALYEAMSQRRAYATDDSDLEIYFALNGGVMGSILPAQKECTVTAYLFDPTDKSVGLVEVVSSGGAVIASQTVDAPWEEVRLSVPGGYPYYYLRITQADGDIAVTAPVWVDSFQDMGIEGFSSGTDLAVRGQEIRFQGAVFNGESVPFRINAAELYAGEELVHTLLEPGTVPPAGRLSIEIPYTHNGLGAVVFRLRVTGTVLGEQRRYEETLTVRYHAAQQVGDILVDGSHQNAGLEGLTRFTAIAGEGDMQVNVFTDGVPAEGKLLVIPPPGEALGAEFTQSVKEFLENGGSLMVFGRAGDNVALNRLLSELGATMSLDTGVPDLDRAAVYNEDAPWSAGIPPESPFYFRNGCAVAPGKGTWLVRDPDSGRVLLAYEQTGYGGGIFAGGSLFLEDWALPAAKNRWDPVSANQKLWEAIVGVHREELASSTIREAREGELEEIFRIRGYATTGTSNPYNTFPGTICLQDSTGGIPVVDFTDQGIQVGTPLEVIGCRREEDGNIVLGLIDYRVLEEDRYRHVPQTAPCESAMDYGAHGGELMQVEGTAVALTYTADGKGISRLILQDSQGGQATVAVGKEIFSGSRGTNTLASEVKLGRTVRAMGILYLEDGAPVLRVRNCEEVVYVPPIPPRPSLWGNPRTGDALFPGGALILMVSSGALLWAVRKKGKRKK